MRRQLDKFCDGPKDGGLCLYQVIGIDLVGPTLASSRSLCASSWGPPTFQKLGSSWNGMDDRDASGVIDNADFQRLSGCGWPDEHRDVVIVTRRASSVEGTAHRGGIGKI